MNELTREAIKPNRAITDPMHLREPAGIKGALVPSTASEAMEMAKMICSGKFAVPNYLHDNPGDCLRIVLVAARSGLDPFMLANESYLVEGKGGQKRMEFMAKAVHAIVLASGVLRGDLGTKIEGQGANLSCTVTGQRRNGRTHTETYYMASIEPKNSPLWKSQPRQQMIYYAVRAWCRAHAPDALMGLIAREDPMIDVTPEDVRINGDPPRGALAAVEAHLGGGAEPEDDPFGLPSDEETESARGETEGAADPGGEAAAEQGRETVGAEATDVSTDSMKAPAPAAEVAENGGQSNGGGLALEEPTDLMQKRLAWLIETSQGAQTKQDLEEWEASENISAAVDSLPGDLRKVWTKHIEGVREALGAIA